MKQTNLQKAQARLREKFIENGVKMLAPETVYFSKDTKIGKNVSIDPYAVSYTHRRCRRRLRCRSRWSPYH